MATTEHTINDAIAALLRKTRGAWRNSSVVMSENSGMLKGGHGQPDILIVEPNVSPVVIETEVLPATTVEMEAVGRLGIQVRNTGRTILSSIAVRLPLRLRERHGAALERELEKAKDIQAALYTGSSPSEFVRWPHAGWIVGGIHDLSIIVQSASIPPDIIDRAADQLVNGVIEAAGLLQEMAKTHPGSIRSISKELHQDDGAQTRRMAAAILVNAFVFYETLAGGAGELANVRSLEELRGGPMGLSKSSVLSEWRKILGVNYWPIFDIARRILEAIPSEESKPLIDGLAATASDLIEHHMMRSHDLTGAVFQRLIADRKFLAAFYTTPASAALLAGLAITPQASPSGGPWADADDLRKLRIADFACGTGTLLTSAYQRVGQLHELAGGNSEALHAQMMASGLIGCDVLPAAAHLTASMLAGAHPTVKYDQSSILCVSFGKLAGGGITLGSLDLLDPQGTLDVFSITAKAAQAMGEAEKETWRALPHASFDLVIMNPPFVRATGHEGGKIGVRNPMFAAFGASDKEQKAMSKAASVLTKGTSAHGNAGEASIFLVLADRKVRCNGTLALVMPLSLMVGEAWDNSRALLAKNYKDLLLVSIAGKSDADMSFSADTDMGECLVIGRKEKAGSKRGVFVVLRRRPDYPLQGVIAAEQIRRTVAASNIFRLEDGPVGATLLRFGDETIGQMLDAPLPDSDGWGLSRIADLTLAQASHQLACERLVWLPTMAKSDAVAVPMTTIGKIGKIGPYHADISGDTASGGVRGPFDISAAEATGAPTYPVLWWHDADLERAMCFDAREEGFPRRAPKRGDQEAVDHKVEKVWSSASHCHFNRDFRFNSQSTCMQFTSRKSLGGRAWLSIKLSNVNYEKALVLWANTSLGLLLYWWHANKQQSGRGSIGKEALDSLPVLDVTALSTKQLKRATLLFDAMKKEELLPVHEIDKDDARIALDEGFAKGVLGIKPAITAAGGPLDLLRKKLSLEPSIRGQK